jgi:tellurite resistance protein
LQWLIESDEQIDIFEFVLQKIVRRHLAPQLGTTRPTSIQYHTLQPVMGDCAVVLSALANVSSSNAGEVEKAFQTGVPYLRAQADGLRLLPREECGLEQLDTALERLALAAPQIKKNLIEACVHVVGADGLIQEREAELLRAVADTLDCPISPFVQITES